MSEQFSFGDQRLVGNTEVKNRISRILASGKLAHAYLLTGPKGVGKKAFALALAEYINGISNLSRLNTETQFSKKSNWFTHPDIHFFFPLTTDLTDNPQHEEVAGRLKLLAEDPYEVIDFEDRPSLNSNKEKSNKQAFYPIKYFREHIRKACLYKPNEGKRTVVIITRIELMRKEAANAFLKLLEEPPEDVLFLLTCDHPEQLLPTITSRCQTLYFRPLSQKEITESLVKYDGIHKNDAATLARLSAGNYSLTRFYDLNSLKESRDEALSFLRNSYTLNAEDILFKIQQWNAQWSKESQLAYLSVLEGLLRDLFILKETQDHNLVNNIDHIDTLKKFTESLPDANLEKMIEEIAEARATIEQNGNFKIMMTVLSMRFARHIRGRESFISSEQNHKHQPAFKL